MSRIGKKPVPVPAKVKVAIDGRNVSAEGPKGKLSMELPPSISAKVDGGQISLIRPDDTSRSKAMHGLARIAVCVDFMSSHVDFQKPGAWHTDPGWALAEAHKLSRRVRLRHDYMPFEFALFIYRDDAVNERRVFAAHDTLA